MNKLKIIIAVLSVMSLMFGQCACPFGGAPQSWSQALHYLIIGSSSTSGAVYDFSENGELTITSNETKEESIADLGKAAQGFRYTHQGQTIKSSNRATRAIFQEPVFIGESNMTDNDKDGASQSNQTGNDSNNGQIGNAIPLNDNFSKSLPITDQTTTPMPPTQPPANQPSNSDGDSSGGESNGDDGGS